MLGGPSIFSVLGPRISSFAPAPRVSFKSCFFPLEEIENNPYVPYTAAWICIQGDLGALAWHSYMGIDGVRWRITN